MQAPQVSHFICAERGPKGRRLRLHFNGAKFTNNGAPAYFTNKAQAMHIARDLLRRFPYALKGYDIYVKDRATKQ